MKIRTNTFNYILAFIFLCFFANVESQIIINLYDAKQAIINYHQSGAYSRDLKLAVDECFKNLESINFDEKSAVVFDVDETLLSNWNYEFNWDFGYNSFEFNKWIDSAICPAIPEVKRLYDSLSARKVHIFIITGRSEEHYDATKTNLLSQGYTKFDGLILRNPSEKKLSAKEYKSQKRKEIEKSGFKIICSVGDQWSDLEGGYTILKVKLPNYMYFIK